jgi:hypothetical protein
MPEVVGFCLFQHRRKSCLENSFIWDSDVAFGGNDSFSSVLRSFCSLSLHSASKMLNRYASVSFFRALQTISNAL